MLRRILALQAASRTAQSGARAASRAASTAASTAAASEHAGLYYYNGSYVAALNQATLDQAARLAAKAKNTPAQERPPDGAKLAWSPAHKPPGELLLETTCGLRIPGFIIGRAGTAKVTTEGIAFTSKAVGVDLYIPRTNVVQVGPGGIVFRLGTKLILKCGAEAIFPLAGDMLATLQREW